VGAGGVGFVGGGGGGFVGFVVRAAASCGGFASFGGVAGHD